MFNFVLKKVVSCVVAVAFLLIVTTAPRAHAADAKKETWPDTHVVKKVEGWSCIVDKRLLDTGSEKELGEDVFRILANQLYKITKVLPADRVADLKKVRIWVDVDHRLTSLQYHPGTDWLRRMKYDLRLVKCVHLPQAKRLVGLYKSNVQPYVMLHELAHAYHDQFLSFNDKRVVAAWQGLVKSKKLEKVIFIKGGRTRHYALTNHKEFFAEMTEAFVGTNDFFPFVRGELKELDPVTHDLLAEIWGFKKRRR